MILPSQNDTPWACFELLESGFSAERDNRDKHAMATAIFFATPGHGQQDLN
jgi:hypothetical protein